MPTFALLFPYLCIFSRDNRDSYPETSTVKRKTLSRLGIGHGQLAGTVPGQFVAGRRIRGGRKVSRLRAFSATAAPASPCRHLLAVCIL
jgi:hypothetical protein